MEKCIDFYKITQTALEEISLEGLQGCSFEELMNLMKPYEDELSLDLGDSNVQQFIWKLVTSREELSFYRVSKKYQEKAKIVSDPDGNRGYCSSYSDRKCIDDLILHENNELNDNYKVLSDEASKGIIIVANQQLRDSALCPAHKCLKYECITDLEYCVLETIAKSRKNGVYTTGDKSLTQIFEIAPKQLHYVLSILEKHDFISKKTISLQKQRSIIYLKRFEQKNETNLEKLVSLLTKKSEKQEYTHVLRDKLCIGPKQFKNLVALGEKQNVFKRSVVRIDVNSSGNLDDDDEDDDEDDQDDDEASSRTNKTKGKTRCVRLLKLVESNTNASANVTLNEEDDEFDDNDASLSDLEKLCSEQRVDLPMYTQMFKHIESCGKSGISLKQLGYLFGLDFYKSRRIGSHLQTHPDIVTLVQETDRGKAKYQTIIMRKFLENDSTVRAPVASSESLKSSRPIQALQSERAVRRKQLVLDYLDEHKICSKYEIDKEIRRVEELEKQKGQIDAKTTKRILLQLQTESKLRVFEFKIKNKVHTGVCLGSINETDDVYLNYLSTFSRSFDFCINNKNTSSSSIVSKQVAIENETLSSTGADESEMTANMSTSNDDGEFKLTKSYIQSVVSKLEFSFTYAKTYGLVSKIQKAIILHRYIHYILYFYEGKEETKTTDYDFLIQNIHQSNQQNKFNFQKSKSSAANYSKLQVPSSKSLFGQQKPINPELERQYDIVNSCVPSACYMKELSWKTFIPPLRMNEKVPKSCLFISDMLACMPLSVFTSTVAINYQIPGLLSILKHPYKRHMLIKDLPADILAAFIHDRRYLQRILSVLQFLACLNLVNFVEHPTIHNQSSNRSVESQMVYVSRHVYIRDTTQNKFKAWSEISDFDTDKFKMLTFKLDKFETVSEYWKQLLNISLNTYKFNVGADLKESKRLRATLFKQTCKQYKVNDMIDEPRPILGDHLGPGGFDSQLFLNAYANWTLPTTSSNSKSSSSKSTITSIEYEDKIDNVYSELAMQLPFGILRGFTASPSSAATSTPSAAKRKSRSKQKLDETMTTSIDTDYESSLSPVKRPKLSSPMSSSSPMKSFSKRIQAISSSSQDTPQSLNKQNVFKLKTQSIVSIKRKSRLNEHKITLASAILKRAKQLRTRSLKVKETAPNDKEKQIKAQSAAIFKQNSEQKRAVWNKDEDDLILLIKVASLYFLPNEKTIQFKIIHDIMNDLMPSTCGKKVKSFGRRMKVLLKSKLNRLYISNKLELCKHSDSLAKAYSNVKLKRNSIANQNEQISLYKRFILDIKSKLNQNLDDLSEDFILPASISELHKKYTIKSQNDIFKQETFFKQPVNNTEIIKNTLHSAIHSSILINDKTPREYEASKLFEQYKDNLLTEVITTMSRQHNIIAPTKCSEMKKKSITAFSKHVGKAYHISQRYQYKWLNNTPATIFNDAKKFRTRLHDTQQLDCTDLDDAGMTCYLAHTLEDKNLDVKIEVPSKIWVSKLL